MNHAGLGFPCLSGEKSRVKAKLRAGIQIVPTSCVILSLWPCSHHMAPPCSPWCCPPPGGAVSPQMAAPSGDAAGRLGRDTGVFRLLWKEAVILKVCPGSQSTKIWSWAPTCGPADMLGCRGKCSYPQLWDFYLGFSLPRV